MGIGARARYRLGTGLRRLPAGSQEPQYDPIAYPLSWARGWLLVERGYSRVRVDVSGAGVSYARLHAIARGDIPHLTNAPSAPMCGWEAPIDVPDMEPGTPVTVTATAEGEAGTLLLGSIETGVSHPVRRRVPDSAWVRELAGRTRIPAAATAAGDGKLRLLVFTHSLSYGGGQLYLHELLRQLMPQGEIECIVCSPEDGPLRNELEEWGVRVHLNERIPHDAARYESRIAELVALARSFGAEAIVANTVLTFDGIDVATRLSLPAIWAIHDSLPVNRCEGGLFFGLDDHVVKRFRAAVESHATLVFEAEATLDLYRGYAEDHRIRCIDWGIPIADVDGYRAGADRERLRSQFGFEPEDRVVVCVGTIEPRKAQVSLALAFGQVAEEHPDAMLVFIGDERSRYSDGLRAVLSRLGRSAERVRVEPVTPDVMQWLEIADGFALVSDVESLPRSIMEAMAFELPVLATRAWGVPELIDDGANGLLCEPNHFASLTGGMRRLLSLPDSEREAIGTSARRTIRESRDARRYVDEWRDLLGRLAGGRETEHIAAPSEASAQAQAIKRA